MSINKVTATEADCIGTKIATKAFEHLIKPLFVARQKNAEAAYHATLKDMGVTSDEIVEKLIRAHVFREVDFTTVTFKGEGYCEVVTFKPADGKAGLAIGNYNSPIRITDPDACDRDKAVYDQQRPLVVKQGHLAKELAGQMTGRSVKYIVAQWPEAAEFVDEFFHTSTAPSMTRPLDVLLGKYLPALPSPVTDEGETA